MPESIASKIDSDQTSAFQSLLERVSESYDAKSCGFSRKMLDKIQVRTSNHQKLKETQFNPNLPDAFPDISKSFKLIDTEHAPKIKI